MLSNAHTALTDSSDIRAESHSLIDELIGTVATGNAKQRLRMLQRITDLFVAGSRGYSSQQIALFDDVLQRLAADIEVKARARLAHRLATVEARPPSSSAASPSMTRSRWPARCSSIRCS